VDLNCEGIPFSHRGFFFFWGGSRKLKKRKEGKIEIEKNKIKNKIKIGLDWIEMQGLKCKGSTFSSFFFFLHGL
jgi:hypothetical protein